VSNLFYGIIPEFIWDKEGWSHLPKARHSTVLPDWESYPEYPECGDIVPVIQAWSSIIAYKNFVANSLSPNYPEPSTNLKIGIKF
jgi:hypothetical protein